MSNYLVDGADLTSIADAIRTKGGTSAQLAFPTDFVSAIEDIQTGGGPYEVTISLMDPTSPSAFQSCIIYEAVNFVKGNQIGLISSAIGSATVTVQSPCNSIIIEVQGGYLLWEFSGYNTMISGGVGITDANMEGTGVRWIKLCVIGNGSVDISGIEWDD